MCLGGVLGTLVETQQFDPVLSCRSSAQSTKKTCAGTIGCRARCAGAVTDSGRPDVYGAFMHEAFFVCISSHKRVDAICNTKQAERDAAPAAVQQPKKQRSKHKTGEPAPGATPCWTSIWPAVRHTSCMHLSSAANNCSLLVCRRRGGHDCGCQQQPRGGERG